MRTCVEYSVPFIFISGYHAKFKYTTELRDLEISRQHLIGELQYSSCAFKSGCDRKYYMLHHRISEHDRFSNCACKQLLACDFSVKGHHNHNVPWRMTRELSIHLAKSLISERRASVSLLQWTLQTGLGFGLECSPFFVRSSRVSLNTPRARTAIIKMLQLVSAVRAMTS